MINVVLAVIEHDEKILLIKKLYEARLLSRQYRKI